MNLKQIKLPQTKAECRRNYSLSHLTWFKVGGSCDYFYKPADFEDLQGFLVNLDKNVPIFTIGAGSNLLIRDGGIRGCVIKLGKPFANIAITDDMLVVGAGCLNYNVAQFCLQRQIKGFEFLIGIPGTIGGGIAMNAGAYGTEFKDIIYSVTALNRSGRLKKFMRDEIGFAYRGNSLSEDLIFVEAAFNYERGSSDNILSRMNFIQESRLSTQPIKEKTCGSTFANSDAHKAWELIDMVEMRGAILGGAQVSIKHCNFLINANNATAKDLEDLGNLVQKKVYDKFGILLKWEIKRVGI